jgi:pyrroloquinoline quinone (PQQ) biosynthesis protein C
MDDRQCDLSIEPTFLPPASEPTMPSPTSRSPASLSPRSARHREVKDSLKTTPHPDWVNDMLASLEAPWQRMLRVPLFLEASSGSIVESSWRHGIKDFFSVVEAFPKYMGLALAKTTYGRYPRDLLARDWLIGNIRVEALHVRWYLDWAAAHGISAEEITHHTPGPEVAALCEWLWSISYRGSLAEAVGAVNYAIEGTTGAWCRMVLPTFAAKYRSVPKALTWLSAHAKYDDAHPDEALEIVKLAVTTPEEKKRVESAIRRSLEFYARGFEAHSTIARMLMES